MTRWAAFLRGVNVGGSRVIRMEALRAALADRGLADVITLGASGNAVFAAAGTEAAVRAQIGEGLAALLDAPTEAFVRTAAELAALAKADPFARVKLGPGVTPYVTFLHKPAPRSFAKARASTGEVEVIGVRGREVLCLHRRPLARLRVYPNGFVEDALGVPATTRNWSTVLSAAAAALPKPA